jgi:hypothetical protein
MMSVTKLLTVVLAAVSLKCDVAAAKPKRGYRSGKGGKNPYLRKNAKGWSAKGDPYAFDVVLGNSIKFWEVQRSGKLSSSPGGYRFGWKKDQLLFDGFDAPGGPGSLAGGHYEAGSAHSGLLFLDTLHDTRLECCACVSCRQVCAL